MTNGHVLVTGANGFVGRAACEHLRREGWTVRAALRRSTPVPAADEAVVVGEIGADTDWTRALAGVDVVLHLAARVHVMRETAADPQAAFDAVNVAGTRALAEQAARAGVRRLVYVSSVKVNGEATFGVPFTEEDPPRPEDPYGRSKWKAEQELRAMPGLGTVIVRPPLVYGPGVRGNFLRLLRLAELGLPLPLAAVNNRRSLIALTNLVDLLSVCLEHPAAAGETFLAADAADVSTADLLRAIARNLHKPARVWPLPAVVLRAAAVMLRQTATFQRLCGSLQVDTAKVRRLLGWQPSVPFQQALAETVRWYSAAR